MKRLSWKYIAGLIDGEGCLDVQVHNNYIRPRVRIGMADSAKTLLDIMHTNHGGFLSGRPSKNEKWQSSTCWELAGYSKACPFLRNIVNHLLLKHEQARLLLWMETTLKGKQVSNEIRAIVRDELGRD